MALLFFIISTNIQILVTSAQTDTILSVEERHSLIRDAILRNQFTQAEYHLNILRQQGEWSTESATQFGDIYAEIGDLATAVHYWEMGEPATIGILERLANGYLDLQNWQLARETLQQLVNNDPTDTQGNYYLGVLEAIYGEPDSNAHLSVVINDPIYGENATQISTALTEISPLARLMRIGTLLIQSESWGLAELTFLRASILNNAYPEALAYQGWSRYQQGKDGASWIDQAITLAPSNGQVLYIRGLEQRYLGNYYLSVDIFMQAIAITPDNPALQAELANTHRLLGNLADAEYWYILATNLSENDSRFQDLLIAFYEEEGANLDQSNLDALLAANDLYPNNPDIQASLGWVLYSSGDREAGISAIETALSLQTNHPRSLYYLGLIANNEGLTTLAGQYLSRVTEMLSPFATLASQALAQMNVDSE